MPFIPNIEPPTSWFAARLFLVEAKKIQDEFNNNLDSFTFVRYIKSITMVLRGIE